MKSKTALIAVLIMLLAFFGAVASGCGKEERNTKQKYDYYTRPDGTRIWYLID